MIKKNLKNDKFLEKINNPNFFIFFIIIIITVIGLNYFAYTPQNIIIDMRASQPDSAQIFFDTGNGYNEEESYIFKLKDNSNIVTYSLPLPAKRLTSIRIDPMNSKGSFQIKSIKITNSMSEYEWSEKKLYEELSPLNHVKVMGTNPNLFNAEATGDDPSLQIKNIPVINKTPLIKRLYFTLIIILLFSTFISIFIRINLKNLIFSLKTSKFNLILFLIVFLTVFHFSFSPIITHDSAHYHSYLCILNGDTPWFQWDVVRGIIFPLIIKMMHFLFGYSIQGILILTYLAYLLLGIASCALIREVVEEVHLQYISYILIIFFILLDPIIVGYYHTLLTEFVAATIILFSTLYAWRWKDVNIYDKTKYTFLLYSFFFILAAPFAWHLKQPYVAIVLLPVTGIIIISILNEFTLKNILQRFIILCLIILSLSISIFIWNKFLPGEGLAGDYSRSSTGLLSTRIFNGLYYFQLDNKIEDYKKEDIINNNLIPENDRLIILKLLDEPSGRYLDSRLVNIYDLNNNLVYQSILVYKESKIEMTESIKFFIKNFIRHPILVIYGYIKNYLGIINIFQSFYSYQDDYQAGRFIITENFSLSRAYENNIIAYRILRVDENNSNIFTMPDFLYTLVTPYKQNNKPPFIFKYLLNLSLNRSNFTFSMLFLIAPFLMLYFLIKKLFMKIYRRQRLNCEKTDDMIIFLTFISFCFIFLHALLGAIIDRYAFPVYPVILLGMILFLSKIYRHFKRSNSNKVTE